MAGPGDPLRILVTGAGGFVGARLCQRLEALPGVVLIATYASESEAPPSSGRRHNVVLDITDEAAVVDTIRRARPDRVLHLAAISNVPQSRLDPRRTWTVNLTGTLNLAQAVQAHAPLARFVFVSTSEIYGASFKASGRPLDESALPQPQNPYAASKAAADIALGQMAADGLNAIRLRPFNHTGPGQTDGFVVPAFAAQIARIEAGLQPAVLKVGNLEAERDFLDLEDVLDAYQRLLLTEDGTLSRGTVFNIASGMPRRIRSVLDDLLALSSTAILVEEDPARMRANDVPFAVGDASRLRMALGWAPRVPWAQTLTAILADWRQRVRIDS